MIDFKSGNEGTWFWFDEDNHDLGGVCLRVVNPEKFEEIERITVKTKKKVKRGVAYDDVTTNEKLASKLRWDFCIVDWKNVMLDGVEVECNGVNKAKLVQNIDFISLVADFLETLNDENTALDEARLKNSETSSSGNVGPVE